MQRIALVGKTLIHDYLYPAYLNGFDREAMDRFGKGWIAKLLRDHPADPVHEGYTVSVLCCPDEYPHREGLMKAFAIDAHVTDPAEAAAQADGALILEDDGDLHKSLAEPFLRRGLAVYVDKPFAKSTSDAKEMLALASENGALLMAGSSLRYAPENEELSGHVRAGHVKAAHFFGPGEWFAYGSHIAEWAVSLFGSEIDWVEATEKEGAVEARLGIEGGPRVWLTAGDTNVPGFQVALFGEDKPTGGVLADRYRMFGGVPAAFARMIETNTPPVPTDEIMAVVGVLEAGYRSMNAGGKRVALDR